MKANKVDILEAELENFKDYVFDTRETLRDSMELMRSDLNKIKDAYLNTILQVKEDMQVLKAYIKQTRDFQKWAVKQTLKEK
tara:strand:- start:2406 stop:2651 length:246 start_codon:yes stop_codon:yes gene_type:complete